MLRRWIPVICVPVLAVMGIALVADLASAGPLQRLRDRRSSRDTSDDGTVVSEGQVAQQQTQQQQPQQTVSGQPQQQQMVVQQSSGRRGILRRSRGGDVVPVTYIDQPQSSVVQAAYSQPQPTSQPVMTTGQPQQDWVMQGRRLQVRRGRGQMVLVSSQQTQQQMQPMQQTGYRVYYRVPTPDAPAGTVLLNVRVPGEAQIWIDGDKTQQTGSFRRFLSPQLDQGKSYVYTIKGEWQQPNGQKISRTRKVTVRAGEAVDIDLGRPTQQELQQQQQQQQQQGQDR
jgi:uncharacterized protein (TIGR03000 family)